MKIKGLSIFITEENINKYIICLIDESGQKYIETQQGLKKVKNFPLIHYRVQEYQNVQDVYDFNHNKINMDYFKLNPRFKNLKRKVWIFKGGSLLGKKFLSDKIDLNKYETDTSQNLPKVLNQEIIVIGNKYHFTIEDIVSRIKNKDFIEFIIVDFSKY